MSTIRSEAAGFGRNNTKSWGTCAGRSQVELAEKLQGVCNRDSTHTILANNLQYWKLLARRVSKMVTAEHKVKRVECARKFLTSFEEEGKEFLDSIIIGDETLVQYYIPKTKQQSKQWRHTHSTKIKRRRAAWWSDRCSSCAKRRDHGLRRGYKCSSFGWERSSKKKSL